MLLVHSPEPRFHVKTLINHGCLHALCLRRLSALSPLIHVQSRYLVPHFLFHLENVKLTHGQHHSKCSRSCHVGPYLSQTNIG